MRRLEAIFGPHHLGGFSVKNVQAFPLTLPTE